MITFFWLSAICRSSPVGILAMSSNDQVELWQPTRWHPVRASYEPQKIHLILFAHSMDSFPKPLDHRRARLVAPVVIRRVLEGIKIRLLQLSRISSGYKESERKNPVNLLTTVPQTSCSISSGRNHENSWDSLVTRLNPLRKALNWSLIDSFSKKSA